MPNKIKPNLPATRDEFNKAYLRFKISFRRRNGNKVQMAKDMGISYHAVLQALRIYEKLGKKITLKKAIKIKK